MQPRRTLVALSMALGMAFAFAAPAAAAPAPSAERLDQLASSDVFVCSTNYFVRTVDGGATACFNPTGEILTTCDGKADGHHPAVWYQINGGSWENKHYDLGNGNCASLNLSIAETGYIRFYAVNYEGQTPLSYSDIMVAGANG
ncbi:hypothetical protein GCM10022225_31430 [Plantactinospora mayteni]|uniref:Secreted protein n=1 Tax=Plantactinospora mayteni TaxID=566021 RepID=A0ABQ4ELR9_9ACTN|nr:hypothetical protein [Plantactinospora mayteni]GIG95692.1 hypothetical protein Pma05_22650 [Plantactinospora mayteni]